jgi:hypothetical protein
MLGEPAETAALRGPKRRAKTDKADARHLRELLATGRLPECWVPPAHVLECRALLETYHALRVAHTAWTQRVHAVLFHQGTMALGAGALSTTEGLERLKHLTDTQLSAAGRLQVQTALAMLGAVDQQRGIVGRQVLAASRHLHGARVLQQRQLGMSTLCGPTSLARRGPTFWLCASNPRVGTVTLCGRRGVGPSEESVVARRLPSWSSGSSAAGRTGCRSR